MPKRLFPTSFQWNRLTWKEVFGSSRPSRLAGRMESSYRFLPWKHQRFGEILRVLLMLGIYSRICLWILARFIQHIVGFQHKFGFKQEEQWSWLTNNRYLDYKQIPKIEDYQQKWNNVWLSSTKPINPSQVTMAPWLLCLASPVIGKHGQSEYHSKSRGVQRFNQTTNVYRNDWGISPPTYFRAVWHWPPKIVDFSPNYEAKLGTYTHFFHQESSHITKNLYPMASILDFCIPSSMGFDSRWCPNEMLIMKLLWHWGHLHVFMYLFMYFFLG